MPTTEGTAAPEASHSATRTTPADMDSLTLVQIAERLERITTQIEAERVREREARARYREVAEQVEARITSIKADASALVREQQRRLSSFDGMLGPARAADLDRPQGQDSAPRRRSPLDTPANIGDAILRLWTLPEHDEPLSTDEIAEALPSVGYESKAAPRSLRSAVNQALAKLCREGRIEKFRQDGSVIGRHQTGARARRYMSTD